MNSIPSGTITFLFTDIVGSTKLWERQPEVMKVALARHDALLRLSIEQYGGYVFKTIGDAFCAAFASATDAVEAALNAHRVLRAEPWPAEIETIRIRAALHTGIADERNGDYFGPPLNRVARLLSAGHGDQTLISLATQELVRGNLPQGVRLLDLGEHRLKDLFRPERVFQVNAQDLPSEFPPLKTIDAKLTNLPAQPMPFIGRERELTAVLGLLRHANVRLVTLTGPGGTGKTRLSLQAAADLLDEYEHGVYFVPLATITDPDLVIPTIAGIFNLKEAGGVPIDALLKQYLAEKHLLLVLDNLEQVVTAAPKIAELLAAAPRLKILTSSREKLRLYGEHEYPVPPLGLPDLKKKPTTAVLSQYEAVALFIQRAKAANPNFEMTDDNARAVAEICVRLDGLPLAIELAAARAKLLAPQAMLERLSSRLKALTGGARDLPARQQTIRGAIDWSYNLLDQSEKTLFVRLGVFVGGWTIEAAEAVCGEGLPVDVFDGLESLSDKSLIHQVDGVGGETRFMMLEMIREYAGEKLSESGDAHTTQDRHLDYFLALAERAEPEFIRQDQAAWLARLEDELDNVRAALGWSLQQKLETGLRLATALGKFWSNYGYLKDGSAWLSQLLAQPDVNTESSSRAKALFVQSELLMYQGEVTLARALAQESLVLHQLSGNRHAAFDCRTVLGCAALYLSENDSGQTILIECIQFYRETGNKFGLAHALGWLGIHTDKDDYARAQAYLAESLAIWREMGNISEVSTTLYRLGMMALWQGDYALARSHMEEGLSINQTFHKAREGRILIGLGWVAYRQGSYEMARSYLEDSLSVSQEIGDIPHKLWSICHLGYLALRQGNVAEAKALFQEGQKGCSEVGLQSGIIYSLEGLASLAVMQGQPDHAVRLFAWGDAMREASGDSRPPIEQADVDRALATIHAQIDEAAFDAAQAAGRTMSMDEAIALALEEQA
jgi:predicted ATPase/class 3 adenylate cyclase